MIDQNTDIKALNQRIKDSIGFHLGIEFTEFGIDYICAKMPVDNRTKQPFGLLHGGASVVLAESLGSIGSYLCVDREKYICVGIEVNANHLKSVSGGYVFGRATALHIGKRTHVWDIKITNELNDLVCISRLTIAVVEKKQ